MTAQRPYRCRECGGHCVTAAGAERCAEQDRQDAADATKAEDEFDPDVVGDLSGQEKAT